MNEIQLTVSFIIETEEESFIEAMCEATETLKGLLKDNQKIKNMFYADGRFYEPNTFIK